MSDASRDLAELKREIIEARNQAIKTDNQMKNLALDVKGFEKRFDALEKRARLSAVGVNIIIAVTITIAFYAYNGLRTKEYDKTIRELRGEVGSVQAAGNTRSEELQTRMAEHDRVRQQHAAATAVANKIVDLVDAKQEQEAAPLLGELRLADLTALERKLMERRLADLGRKAAENSYRAARAQLQAGKADQALVELRLALSLEPSGKYATATRYLLSSTLWSLHRWDEAEPLLRQLHEGEGDKTVQDEARYMHAAALAHLGRRDEARVLFDKAMASGGRYERLSRVYVAALDAGSELPDGAAPPGGAATPASTASAGATGASGGSPANRPAPQRAAAPAAATSGQ